MVRQAHHHTERSVARLEDLLAAQTAERRLSMLMFSLFGLLGLVISAVGIFGVIAYLVSQQTRDIGIRMALGATRSRVVAAVSARSGDSSPPVGLWAASSHGHSRTPLVDSCSASTPGTLVRMRSR
jgi:hypothetical protein